MTLINLKRADFSELTAVNFASELNQLKLQGVVSLWNSTQIDAKMIHNRELQTEVRNSFSTEDFFGDLVRQTKSSQDSFQLPIIIGSIISVVSTAIVLPQLEISTALKNTLGLIGLFGPFLFVGLNILFPEFRLMFQSQSTRKSMINQTERICYHEAGHLLAGYLLGIPVLSYDTSGEKDAGTAIEIPRDQYDTVMNSQLLGAIITLAMSGMVAESLRFGNALGGSEDFSLAYSVLREMNIPSVKREGYLKSGVLQSLILLRRHRDSLDELAMTMKESKDIVQCIEAIEAGAKRY